jgi:chromate transporter
MPRSLRHPVNVSPPKSLADLFVAFLSIGARSFGGVLPWAYRTLVEERRWMTHADFTETIGLCQFLPGPNIGNASIVLGKRWFGLPGAIVAFLGLMALPFVWVLALFVFYSDYSHHPLVQAVVIGVGTAGAGLFIGTALKLARPLANKPFALVLVAACFLCVAVARFSLLIVVPACLAIALVAARWNRL